ELSSPSIQHRRAAEVALRPANFLYHPALRLPRVRTTARYPSPSASPPPTRPAIQRRASAPFGETRGGQGMRHGGRTRRFTAPLAVLAVVLIVPAADAVSLARQCRQACGDEIAACVAAGGRHLAC